MNKYKILRISMLLIFITLFTQFAYATGVKVGWEKNSESDVAGYNVHYGTASRNYQIHANAGSFTSMEIDGLSSGTTYYFAVTAYDYSGNESVYSQELTATMPVASAVNPGSGSSSVSGSSSGSVSSSNSGAVSTSSTGSTSDVAASTSYTLTTSVVNAYGTINVVQSTELYAQGAIVTLTATPDSGYKLMTWTDTDNDTSKNNSNTVTMNSDRNVSVEFEPVSNTEENKDGGSGGGCFMTAATPMSSSLQAIFMLLIAGIWSMSLRGK